MHFNREISTVKEGSVSIIGSVLWKFFGAKTSVAELVRFLPAPGIFFTGSGSFKKYALIYYNFFFYIGTVPTSWLEKNSFMFKFFFLISI